MNFLYDEIPLLHCILILSGEQVFLHTTLSVVENVLPNNLTVSGTLPANPIIQENMEIITGGYIHCFRTFVTLEEIYEATVIGLYVSQYPSVLGLFRCITSKDHRPYLLLELYSSDDARYVKPWKVGSRGRDRR